MAKTRRAPKSWWLWPVFMITLAVASLIAAWLVYPGQGEQLMLLGYPFGSECGFKVATGHPCPQCGMTRSWVYMARGNVFTSLAYNPAGGTLFLWILTGGLVGAVRLIRRKHDALKPPWPLFAGWILFWMIVPYSGYWTGRLLGYNHLPGLLDPQDELQVQAPPVQP